MINRRNELLEWFKNFFSYSIVKKRPFTIEIKEVYGDYRALPRKKYDISSRIKDQEEKQEDYEKYVIAALGTEYKPNSKAKITRDAIEDFAYEKYNHSNPEAVTKRYVKEPFDKHAVTNGTNVWVYYSDYSALEEEVLEDWRNILFEEHISEQEAANAFYRQEQGQDVSKEKQYYKNAMERFKKKYNDTPVLVREWRVRD